MQPICARSKCSILFKLRRDLFRSEPVQGHAINTLDYLCRLVVHYPAFRIVGVFHVTVGRLSHRFACVALDLIADTALFADIACVPFIEQVADRRHLVFTFGGVDIVRDCNKTDIMLGEKFLGQASDLNIVSSETG